MKWFLDGFTAIVAALAVILVVMLSIMGGRDCIHARRCERRGGTVERHNCGTYMMPQSWGDGGTVDVPSEVCQLRCVGASAERHP